MSKRSKSPKSPKPTGVSLKSPATSSIASTGSNSTLKPYSTKTTPDPASTPRRIKVDHVRLSNGVSIPALGMGTFMMRRPTESVEMAIDIGYRLFDCAYVYQNEPEVGRALNKKIREGAVKREDLFIIGKLWNTMHKPEDVIPAIERSLADLCLNYLDAYLMHWPFANKKNPKNEFELLRMEEEDIPFEETWCAMEELVRLGYTRMLGVSNFNSEQISRLMAIATYCPVINEVEVNPYFNQKTLIEFCKSRNIQVIAYAPLATPQSPWMDKSVPLLTTQPVVLELAEKHNRDPGQIILRFLHQSCVIPIPKTDDCERMQTNLDIFDFELDCNDMKEMRTMHTGLRSVPFATAKNFKEYPFHLEY